MRKNSNNFVMDTDWIFQGEIDSEQKNYVLLSYFQKLNKDLEQIKMYPMFTELSLHLGNLQTLLNRNQILYIDKKLKPNGDEIYLSDLKVKDIPQMTVEEFAEYQKILRDSHTKIFDYFNIAKALWSVVYDSMDIRVKRNRKNLESKNGFFYSDINDQIYIWTYKISKIQKTINQTKITTKLLYKGDRDDLTITQLISKFSKTYKEMKEKEYPIFEIICKQIFPLNETMLPIFKRKVSTIINQTVRDKRLLENGVH